MSNYYDDVLAQILSSGVFGNQGAAARTAASGLEDERLRGLMGSKRKRRRGEQEGAYALANYPGLQNAIDWASTGNLPGGSATIGLWLQEQSNPALAAQRRRERMGWAKRQQDLIGGWGR